MIFELHGLLFGRGDVWRILCGALFRAQVVLEREKIPERGLPMATSGVGG